MVSLSQFFMLMAPSLIGGLCMGWICGLIGFLSYFLENSLLAEVLSHAAYPGILLGLWILWGLQGGIDDFLTWNTVLFLTVLVVCLVSIFLEGYRFFYNRFVPEDTLLCWSLSTAMGLSSLLISCFQAKWFCLLPFAQRFLYGQVVFLEWKSSLALLALSSLLTCFLFFFQDRMKFLLFDPSFTLFPSSQRRIFYLFMRFIFTLAILAGLQTGGILVVTSLMVVPALTAQITLKRFFPMALFSALLGGASALVGLLSSLFLDLYLDVSIPPGPVIVLISSCCMGSLYLLAWPKGWLARKLKKKAYERKCVKEVLLKSCLKQGEKPILAEELETFLSWPREKVEKGLALLVQERLLCRCPHFLSYSFTEEGKREAMRVLRLHRLWELYLVKMGGVSPEEVHPYAEEMEHALATSSSEVLHQLLGEPTQDPHGQNIPPLKG
ncbi:Mn-dependent transcriptional regulator MntR [Candidatus Similichlamydia laticola]|uniref:Mn-dependent transcriptional regulator MntR n=2 Tax=Candidatus Similichlamydia laticola TaxID=2170265 RepID=A0A369KJ75_9BACT|nr:Mn-dependent transcriptional regulator MntR [Candidatus Similichlamydia laticola]